MRPRFHWQALEPPLVERPDAEQYRRDAVEPVAETSEPGARLVFLDGQRVDIADFEAIAEGVARKLRDAVKATALPKAPPAALVEQLARLVRCPNVELALVTLRVRVQRRVIAAVAVLEIAPDPVGGPAGDTAEQRVARRDCGLRADGGRDGGSRGRLPLRPRGARGGRRGRRPGGRGGAGHARAGPYLREPGSRVFMMRLLKCRAASRHVPGPSRSAGSAAPSHHKTTMDKQTLSFQAEVKQILHLVTHSLYSNKEIFLRELVSNASDACDKLRFEALNDAALYEDAPNLEVRVSFDPEARTITIRDNGIGMSAEEAMAATPESETHCSSRASEPSNSAPSVRNTFGSGAPALGQAISVTRTVTRVYVPRWPPTPPGAPHPTLDRRRHRRPRRRLRVAGGGGAVNVVFNVSTQDAASFRKSEAQVAGMLARVALRVAGVLVAAVVVGCAVRQCVIQILRLAVRVVIDDFRLVGVGMPLGSASHLRAQRCAGQRMIEVAGLMSEHVGIRHAGWAHVTFQLVDESLGRDCRDRVFHAVRVHVADQQRP